MTDDRDVVAGEERVADVLALMKQYNRACGNCGADAGTTRFTAYIARIEAALAREQSPERKAFVEAAIAFCASMSLVTQSNAGLFAQGLATEQLRDAYRAMIEKERNDA